MVRCQGRVIQAPVFKIVKVPLGYRQVRRNLHPMSLSLVVTVHGWSLKAWTALMESRMIGSYNVPEYPHRPVHHLKRPTTISTSGRITHCEVFFLAGQKNATKGNAGL